MGAEVATTVGTHDGIVDPESAITDAQKIQNAGSRMVGHLDSGIANLTRLGVAGAPLDHYMNMRSCADSMIACGNSAEQFFGHHKDLQAVGQSDETFGNGEYAGLPGGNCPR
jgi:hypothetical protein